jgi:AcrR family transcriptional regulator
MDAGVELFGTRGYRVSSVKAVCDQAGLTERYFYEAFPDREALLEAVYDEFVEDAMEVTRAAVSRPGSDLYEILRAGIEAFTEAVTSDPRRARIQAIEIVGVSPRLEEQRRGVIHGFAGMIAGITRDHGGREAEGAVRLDVISLGLVGFVNELLISYVLGDLEVSLSELIENQVFSFVAVAGALAGPNPGDSGPLA